MVVEERLELEPPTLSIPILSEDNTQDQAVAVGGVPRSPERKNKNDGERPPPPKLYPTPQRAPRSPARSGGAQHDDNPFAPPPSRLLRHENTGANKELLSSPRQQQEEKKPLARDMLLPERLRGETLPPRERSRETAMSSLEVSPEASFDDGEEELEHRPPEQICKSFTFVNGQLLENDAPVNVTSSTAASTTAVDMAMNPDLHLSNPSTSNSPDTPKAVTAVEKFPLELSGEPSLGKGLRSEDDTEIGNTAAHVDASAPEGGVGDPAASPLPEFLPTKDDDSMLVMDDERGLSPLPFDGSCEMMNDDPLLDIAELFFP